MAIKRSKMPQGAPKRLKPMSAKRRKERRAYIKAADRFLKENPRCAVFPELAATQIHHIRGRAGSLYLDQRFWLAVSQRGHRCIHDYPRVAIESGWLAGSGEWNVPPRDGKEVCGL